MSGEFTFGLTDPEPTADEGGFGLSPQAGPAERSVEFDVFFPNEPTGGESNQVTARVTNNTTYELEFDIVWTVGGTEVGTESIGGAFAHPPDATLNYSFDVDLPNSAVDVCATLENLLIGPFLGSDYPPECVRFEGPDLTAPTFSVSLEDDPTPGETNQATATVNNRSDREMEFDIVWTVDGSHVGTESLSGAFAHPPDTTLNYSFDVDLPAESVDVCATLENISLEGVGIGPVGPQCVTFAGADTTPPTFEVFFPQDPTGGATNQVTAKVTNESDTEMEFDIVWTVAGVEEGTESIGGAFAHPPGETLNYSFDVALPDDTADVCATLENITFAGASGGSVGPECVLFEPGQNGGVGDAPIAIRSCSTDPDGATVAPDESVTISPTLENTHDGTVAANLRYLAGDAPTDEFGITMSAGEQRTIDASFTPNVELNAKTGPQQVTLGLEVLQRGAVIDSADCGGVTIDWGQNGGGGNGDGDFILGLSREEAAVLGIVGLSVGAVGVSVLSDRRGNNRQTRRR